MEKKNNGKECRLYLVIGTTGTGKSTLCSKAALLFKEKHPKLNVFILDPQYTFPNKEALVKKGIVLAPCSNLMSASEIIEPLKNGLCIIDDSRLIFDNDRARELNNLCISKRHLNLNIMIIFHSLADVQPKIFQVTDGIFFFKVKDSWERVRNKMPYQITEDIYVKATKLQNNENFFFEL